MLETPEGLAPALALLRSGDLAGAQRELESALQADPDQMPVLRLLGYVLQTQGRHAEAVTCYERVVAREPGDWEIWNNLGNARAATGDIDAAIAALHQAIRLKPDMVEMVINLSNVLGGAGRHEMRQTVMREAARVSPHDARVQTELGVAEAEARDLIAAEAAYRAALRANPRFMPAYVELGLLLETQNQLEELEALLGDAQSQGLAGPELGFLKAWLLRRQGRFAEALPLAEATPASINPVRRAQLLGEIHDRLSHSGSAFAAFAEMNRAADAANPRLPALDYRAQVTAEAALLTPERIAAWNPIQIDSTPPAPVFIMGFPRSGTTLLDTLLMNMPTLHVLEEMPVLDRVEAALGGAERLAGLSSTEANALRRLYFEALEEMSPPPAGRIVVDKFPLHMARMPLIHRLFPDAKIVFVERHPCDTVLSCFMANFELNAAMRHFTDIEAAARLYDAVFDAWTRARSHLPLSVHSIRYEDMIADLEGAMRPLLDFLGLPWDSRVLDNRAAAGDRGYIRTASYSQVAEPIYARAAGRWTRYRDQLAPVLPILAPWADKMGYGM